MTCSSTGDIGDLILLLGVLAELANGPHDLRIHDGRNPRKFAHMLPLLKTLVEAQPYVRSFKVWDGREPIDWRSEHFRDGFHKLDQSLICSTWNHGRVVLGSDQHIDGHHRWLANIPKDPRANGKVMIARSPRYHNDLFPWQRIVDFYGANLRFLGLPPEHADFEQQFGRVRHIPVKDFMEMAALIHGSELFIGNQTAAFAIAEGLKVPRIQETSLIVPDCIYPGGDVQHVTDGSVVLPGLGDADLVLTPPALSLEAIDTTRTPPGGWHFDCGAHGEIRDTNLEVAATKAAKQLRTDRATVRRLMLQDAMRRHPGFFAAFVDRKPFERVRAARQRAGLTSIL